MSVNHINTSDPKANYTCGSRGLISDIENTFISTKPLDYCIKPLPEEVLEPEPELLEPEPESIGLIKGELPDTRKNLSYLQVKTIEEGTEWYRQLDPKIPDDLLGLMARWSFGDLSKITKKDIKNNRKKAKRKGKKDPYFSEIKIDKGEQIVTFD